MVAGGYVPTKTLRTFITMVLLAGVVMTMGTARGARAQISPGPLARAHQSLDGPLSCLKCHAGKSEAMDRACLACHTPISALRSRKRGFHGVTATGECSTCHPDHAGRDFALIKWDGGSPEVFDHARAGWTLEGKHADAECRDCHTPALHAAPWAKEISAARRPESWLGLERECRTCHQDVHEGSLSTDCSTCHNNAGFKPAAVFDHARSEFPLTGKHQKVECAKCHRRSATVSLKNGEALTLAVYKPEAHAECSNCHKDPHQSQLGPKCSECHTTEDFRKVEREDFDHDRTKYPLRGRHAALDCAQCHDPVRGWGKRPVFAACASCHKDPHAGEATLEEKAVDCASCHDEKGFRPSTYSVLRHATSAYPLVGRHAAVACAECHPKAPTDRAPGSNVVRLRPRFAACRDCHPAAHAEQLAARTDGGSCESCHTPTAWKPTLYDRAQHAALSLPLEGRHAEIACADCHGPKRRQLGPLPPASVLGPAGVALRGIETACGGCHVDVHARPPKSTLPGRKPPLKTGGGSAAAPCGSCHGATAFRPSRVDAVLHRDFAFPLEGAHQAVPCQACHVTMTRTMTTPTLLLGSPPPAPLPFGQESTICADCHKTPHGTQFEGRRGGSECSVCHGVESFAPATRFDHERDAAFSLKGGHQDVACIKCHPKSAATADGAITPIVYRPLGTSCESCHARGSVKP